MIWKPQPDWSNNFEDKQDTFMPQKALTAIKWKWARPRLACVELGMTNLISSSSERWTASWAALTAWLFIPRVEQKRLCNLSVYKLPNLRNNQLQQQCKANIYLGPTYQKISSMNGSHLHRLPHLNFQLFHYKFFCSANFFLRCSISNWTYFCNNTTQNKKMELNACMVMNPNVQKI